MNKTVLIIICDFLLISILAMVEFKPNVEVDTVDEEALKDQAAEEMLELLQLSLEHESAQREDVEDTLSETQEALSSTRESLESTEQSLDTVTSTLRQTEAEKAEAEANSRSLASDLEQTRVTLALTREESEKLERALTENERQALRLQEELKAQQEQATRKEQELLAARETLASLESTQRNLETQLQIRDTEKALLQENLVTARAEVERARIEAEKAQARSENLAAGVSELAATSSALKEEIRQAQPLSLNTIYRQFEDNRVFIRFEWTERSFLSSNPRESALQSILVDTPDGVRAIFATGNTPLEVYAGKEETIGVSIKIADRVFSVREIGFLDSDRGIAVIRVPRQVFEESGLQAFPLTAEPLRFSNAVLVKDDQELYGEIPIRIPPGEPASLEIETRLISRLFGEFTPSPGDYVFSLSGELIGIMTRSNRAHMIQDPSFGDFRRMKPAE